MLKFRFATIADAKLYYDWANDISVRQNSFNSELISWDSHLNWFNKKIDSANTLFYVFMNDKNMPVGQVRVETEGNEGLINFSVDTNYRGLSYGSAMLKMVATNYLKTHTQNTLIGYVKPENISSRKCFTKADYIEGKDVIVKDAICKKYIYKNTLA